MKYIQKEIELKPYRRGFHLITDDILRQFSELATIKVGTVDIFIKHTSASLTINENADPTVRQDFESFFNRVVPEDEPYYKHTDEGSDDLPSHIKGSIFGFSIKIPVTNGKLNMGIWQGIYLCEHRNSGGRRRLVITASGQEY